MSNSYLSIVVPAFNEQDSVFELIERINTVCLKNNYTYEIIFINDGSTDKTESFIEQAIVKNDQIKLISFRRNFGKSAALSEGFEYASGEIIITMDADLQDDPAEIINLINKINEGFDLVSGWKKKRNDPISKTLPSKLFNMVTSKLSGISLHDFNCGLKAYRSEVAKSIKVYGEMHRFLPVLAFWQGFRVSEIPVEHHARKFGVSKFGARRFFSGLFDLMTVLFITKYKRKPMHIFGFLGLFFSSLGFGILLYLTGLKFIFDIGINGRPLLTFGVLLCIVGVQFIGVGLLGELMTYNWQSKADYSVKKTLGINTEKLK
jgi:glycosyltransferase involved in cell wall biosynthesis